MEQLTITKFIIRDSGTYQDMYRRSYVTHMDGVNYDNIINRINEASMGRTGSVISPSLISGVVSNILQPSAVPSSNIVVPNGWSERRLQFILEVEFSTVTNNTCLYYFQGYTDHAGITSNGAIDPNMTFYLNSYIRVNRVKMHGVNGTYYSDMITESAHVINGVMQTDEDGYPSNYIMRPTDVFTGMQSSYLSSDYNHDNPDGGSDIFDTRINNNDPVKGDRSNSIPVNYVAKLLGTYQSAHQLTEFGQSQENMIDRCRHLTNEPYLSENPFIRAIMNIKGHPEGISFNYSNLEEMSDHVSSVTNYITSGTTGKIHGTHNKENYSYWNSSDRETVVANVLSNAVPSLMMDLLITNINFITTNHDSNGAVSTVIRGYNSLTNADLTNNLEVFKLKLEKELLYDLTFGNQDTFIVEMEIDLYGDTSVSIQLNSGQQVTFSTPSFCDALLTPTITNNKTSFNNLVNDFETLFNGLPGVNNDPSQTELDTPVVY